MRNLIIQVMLAVLFGAAACTKVPPDHDQTSCARVNFYKQRFTDSTRTVAINDPVLEWPQNGGDNLLCGVELAKDIKHLPQGITLCDVDGTKFYEYHFFTFQPR